MSDSWIQTLGGGAFDLLAPEPEQVDFEVIATVLSRLPRYGGHTKVPVNVAAHSLAVAAIVREWGREDAVPHALIHDAHEAYIGDIPTPVQRALSDFAQFYVEELEIADGESLPDRTDPVGDLKDLVDDAIFAAAGIEWDASGVIPAADRAALDFERARFLDESPRDWGLPFVPPATIPGYIHDFYRLEPTAAAQMLLDSFRKHLPALRGGTGLEPMTGPLAEVAR